MGRFLKGLILLVVVSFYLFPISFTFLPHSINSKILVAVFGIAAFVYDSIRNHGVMLSRYTIVSALIATVFSVWCLFCVFAADSHDYAYASYIVSYLTWMTGAYGVYAALRIGHGEVNLSLLTHYLSMVCVVQCALAVLIDNFTFFEDLVDKFMAVGQAFYKRGHRLYGIGAALDPAGIRFSTVLVLLAHQVAANEKLRADRPAMITHLVSFSIIMIFGTVISRTTLVGAAMGLAYMFLSLVKLRKGGFMTVKMIQIFYRFIIIVGVIILVTIVIYNKNVTFRNYVRFGFEAFFNWVETGDFHTHSSDVLMNTMWIWPENSVEWFVGRGTFGVFDNGTDIGYCNFIFYCGMIGLVIFSLFYIYCHLALNQKFRNFQIVSILLVALTFIVWIKVTTDIFFIDALLFCITADEEVESVIVGETNISRV